jgi:hypothetical protein
MAECPFQKYADIREIHLGYVQYTRIKLDLKRRNIGA